MSYMFVDLNQVLISNLMQHLKHVTKDNALSEDLVRHMCINTIRSNVKQFKAKYPNVVLCCDNKHYWRRDFFPFYKSQRKHDREASGLDWGMIFDTLNKIRDELKEFFPYKVIDAHGAEADDVIAVLTARLAPHGNVLILSSDKDFGQLQKYPNVRVAWKNRFGQFDFMNLYMQNRQSFSVAKRSYQPQLGSWNSSALSYQYYDSNNKNYIIDANQMLSANSNWLPEAQNEPIKQLLTSDLEITNEAYSIAKILGLKLCEFYNKQYAKLGIDYRSVMPTNLYGVNDNFNPETAHVLPSLITKIYKAKQENISEVVCWGDGSPKREFLYVEDAADACIFLMKEYSDYEHINVGSETEVSIKELAEKVKEVLNYEGKLVWDTSKPNGTPRKKLDNTKINNLGWRAKTTFDDGIRKTVEWFLLNKERFL